MEKSDESTLKKISKLQRERQATVTSEDLPFNTFTFNFDIKSTLNYKSKKKEI